MTTTRVIVINCNFANPAPKIRGIIQGLQGEYDPDVWITVETNRGRLRRWLGSGWRTQQGRTMGRENNAIAWEPFTTTPGWGRFRIGSWPRPGVVMQPRWVNRKWLLRDRSAAVAYHACHVPPSRYDVLVPGFMRRIARYARGPARQVWGGDKNQANMRAWAAEAGFHYREAGAMFLASSLPITWWKHTAVKGLDHHVIVADINTTPEGRT